MVFFGAQAIKVLVANLIGAFNIKLLGCHQEPLEGLFCIVSTAGIVSTQVLLRLEMTALTGFGKPLDSFFNIVGVRGAHYILSFGVTTLCSFTHPAHGLGDVFFHAYSFGIVACHLKLGFDVATFSLVQEFFKCFKIRAFSHQEAKSQGQYNQR